MKKYLKTILLLTTLNIYTQEVKQFMVLNVLDSLPIENAYISVDNRLEAISDENGSFNIYGKYNNIQITHLSFRTKMFSHRVLIDNYVIYLEEDTNILDEVVITNKKRIKILLPSDDYRFSRKKSYIVNKNSVYSTYIPNDMNKPSIINSIIIEVGEEMDVSKNYAIPFRVNLYTINKSTKLPDKKILTESILTSQNKNRKGSFVHIDISDFDIEFPKEGVFVVVESLNLFELENFNILSGQSPSFKAIINNKTSKYITYDRIYSWDRLSRIKDTIFKDWIDKTVPTPRFIFNFGIEIKY